MTRHPSESLDLVAQAIKNRKPVLVSTTLTRPADTTAYAANDVIYPPVPGGGSQIKALTFANAFALPGQSALILNARLIDYAAQGTRLSANLYLFKELLGTAPADNAAFAPVAADMANYVGVIKFPNSPAPLDVGAYSVYEAVPNIIIGAGSTRNLYGVLVAQNAYTPVSAEKIDIQLGLLPNDIAVFS